MLQAVIDAALPHSRIVVVGVCQQPDTLTPVRAITKELTMRFVFAYRPGEFGQALDRIAGGSVDVSALSTATLNLDRADEAFDALRPPSEHCKMVLSP